MVLELVLETQDAQNGLKDTLSAHELGQYLQFFITSEQYKDNCLFRENTTQIIITAKQVSELISYLIIVQREQRKGGNNE